MGRARAARKGGGDGPLTYWGPGRPGRALRRPGIQALPGVPAGGASGLSQPRMGPARPEISRFRAVYLLYLSGRRPQMSKPDASDRETRAPAFELMSFGMILVRAIQVYARNFRLLVGITAIPTVLLFLLNLARSQVSTQGSPASELLWLPISLLASLLLQAISTGAVTVAISGRYLGREVSIGLCFQAAFQKLEPLLGAWIVAGLEIILGSILLVVPGIILAVSFCLIAPIIMLEGLPAGRSRWRSQELTRGSRWQIFGLFLIYYIVYIVAIALTFIGGTPFQLSSTSPVASLFNLASQLILAPFTGILTVLIYYNQRIRKESFNLEQLAEAMAEK